MANTAKYNLLSTDAGAQDKRRTIKRRSLSLSAIRFTIGNPTDTPREARHKERRRESKALEIIHYIYTVHFQLAESEERPIDEGRKDNFTPYPSGNDRTVDTSNGRELRRSQTSHNEEAGAQIIVPSFGLDCGFYLFFCHVLPIL